MDNVYYIYDPGYGKLVIATCKVGMVTDEEQLEAIAENEGMKWSNCSWGGIHHIRADID